MNAILLATLLIGQCGPGGCRVAAGLRSGPLSRFFGRGNPYAGRVIDGNFAGPIAEPWRAPVAVPMYAPGPRWVETTPAFAPAVSAPPPVAAEPAQPRQGYQTYKGYTYYLDGEQWYCHDKGKWYKYVGKWEPVEPEDGKGAMDGASAVAAKPPAHRTEKEDTCCRGKCDDCDCGHCHHEECRPARPATAHHADRSGARAPEKAQEKPPEKPPAHDPCDGGCLDCPCENCPHECARHKRAGKKAARAPAGPAPLLIGQVAGDEAKMLAFHADWCEPCKAMLPVEAQVLSQGYEIERHDADKETDLVAKYHVKRLPCYILLRAGRELGRLEGKQTAAKLVQVFHDAQAKDIAPTSQEGRPDAPPLSEVEKETTLKNYGIAYEKMIPPPLTGRYVASGGPEANRVIGALEDPSVPDESRKPYVTAIGTPEETAPVEADIKAGKVDPTTCRFHSYKPDCWAVKGMGYAPGHPRVVVQDAGGKVMWSAAKYDGADGLNEAIRKPHPDYDPNKDPGPGRHGGGGGAGGIRSATILAVLAILAVALLVL